MRELPPTLTAVPGIRLRHEHFGALAWRTEPRKIFQLGHETATLLLLHDQPRSTATVVTMGAVLGTPADECRSILGDLYQQGVLVAVDAPPVPLTDDDVRVTASQQAKFTPTRTVLKPFWAHIQPFTRCNQHCIHCYCSGGPKADPFLLPVAAWCDIVARLDRYGVFDVYVTGGESLLFDGFFDIAEAILERGMGFGVSTNATLLSDRVLDRLRELRIGTVQVSLDGGNAALHELIRGAPGSFTRTLDGIGRIAAFAEPVINTVVNRLNLVRLTDPGPVPGGRGHAMPPVRIVIPLSPPARVLLYVPTLHESGFKQRHVDGEALALYAHLRATGQDCVLLDAYYRGRPAPDLATVLAEGASFDAVVVHLWTSDAYGPMLRRIADELAAIRLTHGVPVIGFGPLATSAQHELRDHGALDYTVGLSPDSVPASLRTPVARLIGDMGAHLTRHTPLTRLSASDVAYLPDAVVSVSASRGCRSRCTFCAYNADLGGGWHELPIAAAVADLAHLHRLTGATRFAFADTDFGGTPDACHRRARALRDALAAQGLIGTVTLAINIRSETLTPDTVTVLAEAGVRTMLLGVESFNDATLRRLYGKRQDTDHLHRIVRAADVCGVTTVASYILWHPWQTIDSLRVELASIDAFGRHRIPQFMARSRLLVIPGTVIEQRIRQAGLLDAAPFHRRFRFADPAASELHDALVHRFETTTAPVLARLSEERPGDLTTLARLKIDEWQWLTDAASLGTSPLISLPPWGGAHDA